MRVPFARIRSPFLTSSPWTDIGAFLFRLEDANGLRLMFRIFDFQHGVRSPWDGRTSHDADRLAWADRLRRHLAGRHVLDDRERDRLLNRVFLLDIVPTHRESVHGAVIPRGIVPFDDDIFAQHAS